MNNTELQVYLANTAHQREVADLQAAGLNPILSAHNGGAAVPNVMSGSGSSGSRVSAKSIMAAGKANPINRALDVTQSAVNALSAAQHINNSRHVREVRVEPGSASVTNRNNYGDTSINTNNSGALNSAQQALLAFASLVPGGNKAASTVRKIGTYLNRGADVLRQVIQNSNAHSAQYARDLLGR